LKKEKTIRDACRGMKTAIAKAIVAAFKATGYMDLYNGDPVRYLQVMRQAIQDYRGTVVAVRQQYRSLRADIQALGRKA
jgi:hypothetical protein